MLRTPKGPLPLLSNGIKSRSQGPGSASQQQARPNRVGLVLPSQPPPQRASLPFQQVAPQDTSSTCWTTMGGARGALALTRADPGSPSRGRGGVGPSLPLSPSPPYVTQPRGCRSAPQPRAESVRRPGGPRPNQTAPHPRHYLTGELGGNRDQRLAVGMGSSGSSNPFRVFLSSFPSTPPPRPGSSLIFAPGFLSSWCFQSGGFRARSVRTGFFPFLAVRVPLTKERAEPGARQ